MSEGIATSEITVHSQSQADVEALVQAAVSVLTNDMQIATHENASIHTEQGDNTVQLLVDTCSANNIQDKLYMCTDCNLAFYGEQGEQEWHFHLKQHRPHKCDLCSEAFEQKDSLKTHMRTHTLQMPYICDKCGSAYSLKTNLIQHMKTHSEKIFQCTTCEVSFKTEQDLNKHMKFHSGEMVSIYQCEVCNKTFGHQKNLAQHMKIHQGVTKQYKCPECPASYNYKCHLTRHLMIHTGDKPYKCKFCGKAFNRNAHLVRHRKIHNGGEKEWKCEQCGFSFWEKSDLVRHIKSHEGNRPFKCDFCEQTFVWKRYLYKHLKNNHRSPDKHFCPDCCSCYATEEDLQQHQTEEHPQKKPLTHTCDVCGQEFYFKYKLDEHMYQHTGRKAHECDKCSLKFVSRKELERHRTEHSQEVSFSCNTCDKSFLSVGELQNHLRMHTGNGKYTCPICSVPFRWRSQLTNHMVVHSNDHDFNCSMCEKKFKRKRDLTRHVKIYHDTKPPYTCTECNEDFHSPFNLHQHKSETHWKKQDELESYYSCRKCSGMFRIKSDLERHMNKVHPPRPYLCTLCSKRFTCLKWLEKHFEVKHPAESLLEGGNYEIHPVKQEAVVTEVTAEEIAETEVDELNMAIESTNQDVKEVNLDHVYADGTAVQVDDGSVEQNVVVVQTIDDQIVSTSVQPHTPMSEAITLAEFSQQATGNTVIPVFLQSAEQTVEEEVVSKIDQQGDGQSATSLLPQPPKLQRPRTTKIPQIIKITRSTAEGLMNQTMTLSSTGQPVRVYKNATTTDQRIKQIRIIPLSSAAGSQQFAELTPVKQEQPVTITIVDEAMQTEQTDVL